MQVIIVPQDKSVARYAYKILMDRLSNGINTIGLPCGRPMLPLYTEIANGFKRGELDFSGVSIFSQTEFLCMEGNEQGSCRQFLEDHLFCWININPDNVHHLDGVTDDHVRECQYYEDDIEYLGGIKLQLLALGHNGQIAFNEPGVSLSARTGFAPLSVETMEEYQPLFPPDVRCPRYALSMGIGTIMEADECLIIATGEAMANAVAATVEGPVSASCPASALQYHTNSIIVVDEAAAQNLRHANFYKATVDAEDQAIAELMAYRNDAGIE